MGVTPNPEGLIPEKDSIRLIEFGQEIEKRFSNPLAVTSGTGETITLKLPEMKTVNQVVIMENIAQGERVREFIIEGNTADGWQEIFKGSCIGHKFIHQFDTVDVSEICLKISDSKGAPKIKELALYYLEK